MKKLAIIGGNGLLGSDLVSYLSPYFSLTSITKENYSRHVHSKFDIVINANGNSRRFWANENPIEDFSASTVSVYKSIFDFPCDVYIYISSPDVYENHANPKYANEDHEIDFKKLLPYGFHKYLSEIIVRKYTKNFLVLRCAMILGTNLKKGPIYDVIHKRPLYISNLSRLQCVTTNEIAEIIKTIIKTKIKNEVINIGGIGTFDFAKIQKYYKRKITYSPQAEEQLYDMNVEKLKGLYPKLKSSEEYVQEFLYDF